MAWSGSTRSATVFAGLAAALVTTYFAFLVFAGWVIVQYGFQRPEFGWRAQVVGAQVFVGSVDPAGPASGALLTGDTLLAINDRPVQTEADVSLALRSHRTAGPYRVSIHRAGARREVWLRAAAATGTGFFRERLPLLGSSFLIFLAAVSMLLNWNSPAAQMGFLAALTAALRLGVWALLPLAGFFSPQEFRPYFVFWLPVLFGLPLAYQALLRFPARQAPSPNLVSAGWILYGAAGAMLAGVLYTGAVPAPVPEGFASVRWEGIEYQAATASRKLGVVALLAVFLAASIAWVWRLCRDESGDPRRRAWWLLASGFFFVGPYTVLEIRAWLGDESGVAGYSWLPGLAAISYSWLVTADRVMHPSTVFRGVLATLLPERVFRWLDRRWFPYEFSVEEELRALATRLRDSAGASQLEKELTAGVDSIFQPRYLGYNPEMSLEDRLEVGPKLSGEPYTRRERRLLLEAVRQMCETERSFAARMNQALEPVAPLNLLRECPRCGACYGSDTVRCEADGEVPVAALPIERLIEGKYQLERLLGRGGMGAVYAGRDLRLNRRIAVKVMLSELFGHHEALRRFEREAQAAARLNHPNVVQIYDYGPIGKMGAFLVMERVEGRTWRDELNAVAPQPVAAVLCTPWIEQLLEGVEAAHQAGIIHRDLKPENLFLADSATGTQLKILDFGLAKMQVLSFSREERLSLGVTAIGTVGYVPPEQLSGAEADERSDLYAIGRIIVETLTGRLPEQGVGGIEPPLGAVLARCVAPDKEARYPNVAALRSALLPALAAYGAAVQR